MSLEQSYSSFHKLIVSVSNFAKDLHERYGLPSDRAPVEQCEAMVRELEMANKLPAAKMRPSWEFYRDCIGVKDLIENCKEEFFTEGAKRIRRKDYVRADISEIWNKLMQGEKDELWKGFKRALKLAEKIHDLTPPEEQQRLKAEWP